jgi:pimeloyl-ACP methyl ester carboxylesterase
LVGHSLGGLYVRAFAGAYPDEVAGLVLVDPMHEAEALGTSSMAPEPRALSATVAQLRADGLPAIPVSLIVAMGPCDIPFMTASMRASRAPRRAERVADSVANANWIRNVPAGRLIVTWRSGHNVPQEEPELVVRAIREMVEDVRPRR